MDEFEKSTSPDALITETIFINELESIAADITFEEKRLAELEHQLAVARDTPMTVENTVRIEDIKKRMEACLMRLAIKNQELSDFMDVQGFADRLLS